MASVTARLSMMGESGYGEPEKDANSVSIELDKGRVIDLSSSTFDSLQF